MPDCEQHQIALSAMADGEEADIARAEVDRHLGGCDDCQAFVAASADLDRLVAAVRAVPVADRTAQIMAATAAAEGARRSGVRGVAVTELRGLLGLAATVQLVVALAALLGVGGDHVARDLAVLEIATAGGLAAAAWRPRLAAGVLPVVVVAAAAGVLASVADVVLGTSGLAGEMSHLVLAVAVWPLAVLARLEGPGGTVPAS